jgi:hypothetical protein
MKRKCLNCKYGYTPTPGHERNYSQSCSFGLKEGAAPVGEFCPMDGKRLHNLRKGSEK